MTTNLYSEIIKCLVDQPGVDVNAKGIGGKTPLHLAIELDELSLLNVLLSKKNVNPFTSDNEGKTSLDYAKDGQKNEILKALISNKYGHEEDNLLHLAAIMNEANAVRFLINNDVSVNVQNSLLQTPLHLSSGAGHKEIVEILVKEGNAEIDVFDARNKSPMDYAINNKKLDTVKLLLKLGGNVNLARTGKGSMNLSPLHNAVSNTNYDERDLCLDIVRCLINSPNSKVNLQDYENKTPLHYADRLKTIETLLTREDIDPLIKDDSGKTPFCYAKEENKSEIVRALINSRYGQEKNSLLHLAAQRGYVELVEDILKEEIEIDVLNDKEESPIYLAAKRGNLNIVKLLLKKGADVTEVFQHAIRLNDKKLIKLLLKEKSIVLFGRHDNFPTFHMLSNKYLEERKTADRKIRGYSNAIYICAAIYVVAISVIYSNLVTTIAVGVIVFVTAILASKFTQKYIEEKFQKKMSIELESERESEATDTTTQLSDVEPALSDVEIQSEEEDSFTAFRGREVHEEQVLGNTDTEIAVNSRCRQHGI